MTNPIDRKASIVAELADRLANAGIEEDAAFLADQLGEQVLDLEQLCIFGIREAENCDDMINSLDAQIERRNERKARLKRKREDIRTAVANALQESGLMKIVAPDLTVSLRMNKPNLIIDGEPNHFHREAGFATETVSFKWDKQAIVEAIEGGREVSFARLSNAAPTIQVRGK